MLSSPSSPSITDLPDGSAPEKHSRAHDVPAAILAWTLFLVPAVGVPNELMAQDTLKSVVVAIGVLIAALVFFWHRRQNNTPLLWHGMLVLPLVLMLYALGSMLWSHTYLAGVEAIRWFILTLLGWLGLNTVTRKNVTTLLWGIHGGAVVASIWAALQFWFGFDLFSEGPAPASTFYNRNFFGEYAVCVLPFSVWLLTTLRSNRWLGWMALSLSIDLTAMLMTGTRSALTAMFILLPILLAIMVRYKTLLAWGQWKRPTSLFVLLVLLGGFTLLGNLPTNNPRIVQENTGVTAWQRATVRTVSMTKSTEFTTGSFSVRSQMWRATLRMMMASPITGVGAGAWEVHIPLFQSDDTTLEIDYYAHNEYLQLLSEYGLLTGGLVLAFLGAYWLYSVGVTRRLQGTASQEAALRAFTLASMLAMGIVSAAGFPWHLAGCGALFALGFAILCGSDTRLGRSLSGPMPFASRWKPLNSVAIAALICCLGFAAFIAQQAVRAERTIVQALLLADTLAKSKEPWNPDMQASKERMLELIRQGIALNPHYRKLTPMVAEVLMAQGDWANAAWILKSVSDSRPHVAALWRGQALAYAQLHQRELAQHALQQVKRLRPDTKTTQNLEIVVLSNTGQEARAASLLRTYFDNRNYDYDMVQAGYALGLKTHDQALAIRSLELRNLYWPAQAADGYFRMGTIYAEASPPNDMAALTAFASGLQAVPPQEQDNYMRQVPQPYRRKLQK